MRNACARIVSALAALLATAAARADDAVHEDVIWSRSGGLIATQVVLSVESPATPGAVVRFTTDNTVPTDASPAWTGPLTVDGSTIVRARVFADGLAPGPVTSRHFLRLGPSLTNHLGRSTAFSSTLPVIVIGTFGADIEHSRDSQFSYAVVVAPDAGGTASLDAVPDYEGRGAMHLRGEASATYPQRPLAWETQDENGDDAAVSLLGMPAESDWVLGATYTDKTLMRNALAYSLMRALRGDGSAMRTRLCEVFVSTDPARDVGLDDYRGVYVLTEKIKRDRNRVDVAELEEDDTDPAAITGGYIFRRDHPSDHAAFTTALDGVELQFIEPDPPNAQQAAYLESYMNAFEAALAGPAFADPASGYASFIDPETFIDNEWFVEITKQVDGYRFSSYFQKDRGRRVRALPLWDYDLSFGNAAFLRGSDPRGWLRASLDADQCPWYPRLHEDPAYALRSWDRYWELRHGVFADAALVREIRRLRRELLGGRRGAVTNRTPIRVQSPAARHFRRWPILGRHVRPNARGAELRTTYQSEVTTMLRFARRRLAWIDRQNHRDGAIFRPPRLSLAAGPTPPGARVLVEREAGPPPKGMTFADGTIFITTDGRDPRGPDGAPQGTAYAGALEIAATLTLKARLFDGSTWGPLAHATYVVGTVPATSANVVVSELMYHAADPSAAEATAGFADGSAFDWLEVANVGPAPVDLSGLRFTEGVTFDGAAIPTAQRSLAPGEAALLVANRAAFLVRYGEGAAARVIGEYAGSLSNGGERIVAVAGDGSVVADFTYDDAAPWVTAPDGAGPSLELSEPSADADPAAASSWRASVVPAGTPGDVP